MRLSKLFGFQQANRKITIKAQRTQRFFVSFFCSCKFTVSNLKQNQPYKTLQISPGIKHPNKKSPVIQTEDLHVVLRQLKLISGTDTYFQINVVVIVVFRDINIRLQIQKELERSRFQMILDTSNS